MHWTLVDFRIYVEPGSQGQKDSERINILKYKTCYLALILYASISVALFWFSHVEISANIFVMFYISINCEIFLWLYTLPMTLNH